VEEQAAKRWVRTFPRTPESVAAARRFVHDSLNVADEVADLDVVVLCTSELVTNAIVHTGGDHFDVEIVSGAGGIGVSVFDSEPAVPETWRAETSDLHGRGISLVEALSDSWGVDPEEQEGKRVWFRLDARPPRSTT
jgi:anti-sigma regulatory factor (Ser/Thr protein kinase)